MYSFEQNKIGKEVNSTKILLFLGVTHCIMH
jgi:hypothetical protein